MVQSANALVSILLAVIFGVIAISFVATSAPTITTAVGTAATQPLENESTLAKLIYSNIPIFFALLGMLIAVGLAVRSYKG